MSAPPSGCPRASRRWRSGSRGSRGARGPRRRPRPGAGSAPTPTTPASPPRAEIAQLEAIGYVGATLPPVAERAGVFLRTDDADPSPRFYASGDGAVARLISVDGAVLHAWRASFRDVFPGYPVEGRTGATENWRRARLLPDGSVLAIWEGSGWFGWTATPA